MTELTHGSPSTYNNHKCRCADCKKAWADYIRERGYVRRYQQRLRDKKKQEAPASIPPLSVDAILTEPEEVAKLYE